MDKKDKNMVIIASIICIAIICLSPFIASSNPDGLEKSAEDSGVGEIYDFYQAPLPDYSIEGLGEIGEIATLIIETIIVLILLLGIGKLLIRKN